MNITIKTEVERPAPTQKQMDAYLAAHGWTLQDEYADELWNDEHQSDMLTGNFTRQWTCDAHCGISVSTRHESRKGFEDAVDTVLWKCSYVDPDGHNQLEIYDDMMGLNEEVMLHGLDIKNGEATLLLSHPIVAHIAADMAATFDEAGAANYVETEVLHKPTGRRFAFHIQLVTGLTPHQKAEAAIAEAKMWEERAATLSKMHEEQEEAKRALQFFSDIYQYWLDRPQHESHQSFSHWLPEHLITHGDGWNEMFLACADAANISPD